MDEAALQPYYDALGVSAGVSLEELERAYLKKNFGLLKGRSGSATEANPQLETERTALRDAYDRLAAHLREQQRGTPRRKPQLAPEHAPAPVVPPPPPPPVPVRREIEPFAIFTFDNWAMNTFVPPLLLAFVWLMSLTFLGAMKQGPSVCVHEFGHATMAWLSGWKATPLPFGWTPVEPHHSNAVYFGLLALLVLLFVAGLRERKIWPMAVALVLALLQFQMTWRMPDARKDFWVVFGGVGGEFVLSTLLMLAFWMRMPEKFKWHWVRYLFFLIGATAFMAIWVRWVDIHKGLEEIPFGSMINGEDDANGDMNRLMDEYGWKKVNIRNNYYHLGQACWAVLGFVWLCFALRLNKIADRMLGNEAEQ